MLERPTSETEAAPERALESAAANTDLPALPPCGPPVFSSRRRLRTSTVHVALTLGSMALPWLVAYKLVQWMAPNGTGAIAHALWLGAAATFWVLCWLLVRRLPLLGNRQLRREVAAKLAAEGAGEAAEGGLWVGVAVGEEACTYDMDTDWDVGFLLLRGGLLLYYGDRARFALQAEQVRALEVTEPAPLDGEIRLQLTWRDPPTGTEGVLTFDVRDRAHRGESRAKLEALRERLEAWRSESHSPEGAALPLPLPPVEVEGGVPRVKKPKQLSSGELLPRPGEAPDPVAEALPRPGGEVVG